MQPQQHNDNNFDAKSQEPSERIHISNVYVGNVFRESKDRLVGRTRANCGVCK